MVIQLFVLWLIARQKTYESRLLFAQQENSRYAEQVIASNQRLKEGNAQLEQANRLKDQFLAMASHELKTPLTTIHGYVQLLLWRFKKKNTQQPECSFVSDSLTKVEEQTRRLTVLVNDLLDVNRLRSGKMPLHLTPHDLCSLCREVIQEQQDLTGRFIDLVCPVEPVIIQIDKERFSQVLTNLISNALKYSQDDTTVLVQVSENVEKAILAVQNDGPPLSEEQQQRIFEPFYRSPAAQSSSKPGWGLGLVISKEIVEQHQGRVWVESSEEKGTTFFVTLPSLRGAHNPFIGSLSD